MQSGGGSTQHGPFHRLKNPTTQNDAVAYLQAQSGEIWGAVGRWSYIPTVRAYVGPLPPQAEGIEFTTSIAPSRISNRNVFWYQGDPGVITNSKGFAVITVAITKKVP
jgi:hypothetical protein